MQMTGRRGTQLLLCSMALSLLLLILTVSSPAAAVVSLKSAAASSSSHLAPEAAAAAATTAQTDALWLEVDSHLQLAMDEQDAAAPAAQPAGGSRGAKPIATSQELGMPVSTIKLNVQPVKAIKAPFNVPYLLDPPSLPHTQPDHWAKRSMKRLARLDFPFKFRNNSYAPEGQKPTAPAPAKGTLAYFEMAEEQKHAASSIRRKIRVSYRDSNPDIWIDRTWGHWPTTPLKRKGEYYEAQVQLGSPLQMVNMVLDTGSDKSWVLDYHTVYKLEGPAPRAFYALHSASIEETKFQDAHLMTPHYPSMFNGTVMLDALELGGIMHPRHEFVVVKDAPDGVIPSMWPYSGVFGLGVKKSPGGSPTRLNYWNRLALTKSNVHFMTYSMFESPATNNPMDCGCARINDQLGFELSGSICDFDFQAPDVSQHEKYYKRMDPTKGWISKRDSEICKAPPMKQLITLQGPAAIKKMEQATSYLETGKNPVKGLKAPMPKIPPCWCKQPNRLKAQRYLRQMAYMPKWHFELAGRTGPPKGPRRRRLLELASDIEDKLGLAKLEQMTPIVPQVTIFTEEAMWIQAKLLQRQGMRLALKHALMGLNAEKDDIGADFAVADPSHEGHTDSSHIALASSVNLETLLKDGSLLRELDLKPEQLTHMSDKEIDAIIDYAEAKRNQLIADKQQKKQKQSIPAKSAVPPHAAEAIAAVTQEHKKVLQNAAVQEQNVAAAAAHPHARYETSTEAGLLNRARALIEQRNSNQPHVEPVQHQNDADVVKHAEVDRLFAELSKLESDYDHQHPHSLVESTAEVNAEPVERRRSDPAREKEEKKLAAQQDASKASPANAAAAKLAEKAAKDPKSLTPEEKNTLAAGDAPPPPEYPVYARSKGQLSPKTIHIEGIEMNRGPLGYLPSLMEMSSLVSFYFNGDEGCFSAGHIDSNYYSGQIRWVTASHDKASWTVPLTDILVDGGSIGVCNGGSCTAAIHTGSTLIRGAPGKIMPLLEALPIDPNCMSGVTERDRILSFVVAGDIRVDLNTEDQTQRVDDGHPSRTATYSRSKKGGRLTLSKGAQCSSVLSLTTNDITDSSVIVLGTPFLQKFYTIFDYANSRIGFAKPKHEWFTLNGCAWEGGILMTENLRERWNDRYAWCRPPPMCGGGGGGGGGGRGGGGGGGGGGRGGAGGGGGGANNVKVDWTRLNPKAKPSKVPEENLATKLAKALIGPGQFKAPQRKRGSKGPSVKDLKSHKKLKKLRKIARKKARALRRARKAMRAKLAAKKKYYRAAPAKARAELRKQIAAKKAKAPSDWTAGWKSPVVRPKYLPKSNIDTRPKYADPKKQAKYVQAKADRKQVAKNEDARQKYVEQLKREEEELKAAIPAGFGKKPVAKSAAKFPESFPKPMHVTKDGSKPEEEAKKTSVQRGQDALRELISEHKQEIAALRHQPAPYQPAPRPPPMPFVSSLNRGPPQDLGVVVSYASEPDEDTRVRIPSVSTLNNKYSRTAQFKPSPQALRAAGMDPRSPSAFDSRGLPLHMDGPAAYPFDLDSYDMDDIVAGDSERRQVRENVDATIHEALDAIDGLGMDDAMMTGNPNPRPRYSSPPRRSSSSAPVRSRQSVNGINDDPYSLHEDILLAGKQHITSTIPAQMQEQALKQLDPSLKAAYEAALKQAFQANPTSASTLVAAATSSTPSAVPAGARLTKVDSLPLTPLAESPSIRLDQAKAIVGAITHAKQVRARADSDVARTAEGDLAAIAGHEAVHVMSPGEQAEHDVEKERHTPAPRDDTAESFMPSWKKMLFRD